MVASDPLVVVFDLFHRNSNVVFGEFANDSLHFPNNVSIPAGVVFEKTYTGVEFNNYVI